uniref:Brevican core protein n=1 Tax=Malurus cyaneus samueli TaxID=2593467 RepID=A0A8C5U4Z5_9PASS
MCAAACSLASLTTLFLTKHPVQTLPEVSHGGTVGTWPWCWHRLRARCSQYLGTDCLCYPGQAGLCCPQGTRKAVFGPGDGTGKSEYLATFCVTPCPADVLYWGSRGPPTPIPLMSPLFSHPEDLKALQVSIPRQPALDAVLAGDITIPCLITYLGPQPTAGTGGRRAVLGTPRVKWTFISEGREVEILVARGDRVKVSEDYRLRASLPIFHQRYTNASLLLTELRPNDSGIYRCDVQHGIEDGHDILHVKVKGVVFHYREGSMRYAYTFAEAQEACARIGASIATPEQLYAAYLGGYEQCDAGWIADQTVRYPIQTPREACYGDMNGFPGVRNYGVVDPEDMYDVYCYAEDLPGARGALFPRPAPQFTLEEAAQRCRALGAELASPGQLYAAWNAGLDACSPGWLADGSVRYPIVTPRERCGGALPGVKTIFLFRNQTGFPDAQSRYDAYCFRGKEGGPRPADVPGRAGRSPREATGQGCAVPAGPAGSGSLWDPLPLSVPRCRGGTGGLVPSQACCGGIGMPCMPTCRDRGGITCMLLTLHADSCA